MCTHQKVREGMKGECGYEAFVSGERDSIVLLRGREGVGWGRMDGGQHTEHWMCACTTRFMPYARGEWSHQTVGLASADGVRREK